MINLTRRKLLGGLAASLLFPPKALASSLFGGEYTKSGIPNWANYGGELLEQEQNRGFYEIFHDVRKEDSEEDSALQLIASTYGISVKSLVSQTGVKLSRDLFEGQRLIFDVPTSNFGDFTPYSYNENKSKVLKLTGDKLAQIRLKDFGAFGHKRLAFLLGFFTEDYAANPSEYIPNLEKIFRVSSQVSLRNEIDPFLPLAIAWHESGGRDWTISGSGAMGAFGLTSHNYISRYSSDNTFKNSANPFITPQASEVSIDYLSLLLTKNEGDKEKALAMYHNGETRGVDQEGLRYAQEILAKEEEIETSPDFFDLRTQRNYI